MMFCLTKSAALLLLAPFITYTNAAPFPSTYDYIVVGSGPGGAPLASNLARAGFSTLLIEAGDNEIADPTTNVAALGSLGSGPALHWDFWVRHYSDVNQTLKYEHLVWRLPNGDLWVGPGSKAPQGAHMLGVNYPRGATLGGSSIVNAGAVFLPSDSDWDYIANLTGDASWRASEMRRIFVKTEKNNYLPRGTPGHGFDGYLDVNIGDGNQFLSSPPVGDIFSAIVSELGKDPKDVKTLLTADANYLSPDRDYTTGLWALPFHVNKTWGRYSARNRILTTYNAVNSDGTKKYPLHLQLNSLVSRVFFDTRGSQPIATGVEYIEGKSVYKGDPRYSSTSNGTLKQAYARKEIIISGGTFNTPQLLKLSGIGPAEELRKFNITVIKDLQGVGTNLQDNQEIAVVGLAAVDNLAAPAASGAPACTPNVPNDPCYSLWLQDQGPYTAAGPNSDILLLKTNHSVDGERDMTMFPGPFVFRGFWPITPNQSWPEPPNSFGVHSVKMHPQNRAGTVRLRSADPTEMPEINFNLFSEGADTDIGAMLEAVAFGRRALARVQGRAAPVAITHPPCTAASGVGADGKCASDEDWIRAQTFGHHATSSCKIGGDGDKNAVLDSAFRVRGVSGLRVVDASVFPRIPGSFPVVATYLVSEKASEVILGTNQISV